MPELVNRTCSIDREPSDDQLAESHLVRVDRPESPASVDRRMRSSAHRFRGVAEQPGGVVAEQVDEAMPVDVDEELSLG